ncbi:MAG: hypothetical protein U0Z75_04920 [Deinococcaceae bacterium]
MRLRILSLVTFGSLALVQATSLGVPTGFILLGSLKANTEVRVLSIEIKPKPGQAGSLKALENLTAEKEDIAYSLLKQAGLQSLERTASVGAVVRRRETAGIPVEYRFKFADGSAYIKTLYADNGLAIDTFTSTFDNTPNLRGALGFLIDSTQAWVGKNDLSASTQPLDLDLNGLLNNPTQNTFSQALNHFSGEATWHLQGDMGTAIQAQSLQNEQRQVIDTDYFHLEQDASNTEMNLESTLGQDGIPRSANLASKWTSQAQFELKDPLTPVNFIINLEIQQTYHIELN